MTNKEAREILQSIYDTPTIIWTNGAPEAFEMAIKALEDRPTGDRKCVTCKYCDGEIINKPCRMCSHAWADLYEEAEND